MMSMSCININNTLCIKILIFRSFILNIRLLKHAFSFIFYILLHLFKCKMYLFVLTHAGNVGTDHLMSISWIEIK